VAECQGACAPPEVQPSYCIGPDKAWGPLSMSCVWCALFAWGNAHSQQTLLVDEFVLDTVRVVNDPAGQALMLMLNSNGAGACVVIWVFQDGRYRGRTVFNSF